MQALDYKNIKKLEFLGYDIISDLKRLSEEIDYSITVNKKVKIFKGLKKVFIYQKKKFNSILRTLDNAEANDEDLLYLKLNLYNEYINFLDHIVFLKGKENTLDNIRILFNRYMSSDIEECEATLCSVKNYKVLLSYLFRKNFDLRKKCVIKEEDIKQMVLKLAKITKYIENCESACYTNIIEIELLINLIFRYLTFLTR